MYGAFNCILFVLRHGFFVANACSFADLLLIVVVEFLLIVPLCFVVDFLLRMHPHRIMQREDGQPVSVDKEEDKDGGF